MDAISVGGNALSTAIHNHIHVTIVELSGNLIGVLLCGIAVSLGISSLLLFSSTKGAHSRQRYYFLYTYTIILLLLLVGAEIILFIAAAHSLMTLYWLPNEENDFISRFNIVSITLGVLVVALTDGLLVWRCFLVQRVLGRGSSKWFNIFWIFPACLWGVVVVAGLVGAIEGTFNPKLFLTALTGNIILNAHATAFITARLLLHRRIVIACVRGNKVAVQHVYIVGILLESAAINLPVTIIAAVGMGIGNWVVAVMLPIVIASQALAAVLIIHQTALGRIFNQQKEAGINKLVEKEEQTTSGA